MISIRFQKKYALEKDFNFYTNAFIIDSFMYLRMDAHILDLKQ